MSIYWQETKTVAGVEVSAIRSTTPLHYSPDTPITAEIAYMGECGWEAIWAGPAQIVVEVRDWILASLEAGASIDEVEDYILESPEKFR